MHPKRHAKHIAEPSPVSKARVSYRDKAYRWNRKNYSRQRRFVDIWTFVLTWLTWLWLDSKQWSYRGGFSEEKKIARRRKQAIWVRETFE